MTTQKQTAKLTNDERRQMVLEALEGDRKATAARYGIARSWLYRLLDRVCEDPEQAVEEAQKELRFRKRVRNILAGG